MLTPSRFSLPCLGLAAAAMMAMPASAVTVFDDSFADGDLAKTGANDTNWWTSSSSSGLEIAPGALGHVTGTSGRGFHTVFSAVQLDDLGDKITVDYTFTTPATVGTNRSTAFRVGLFNSLGRAGLEGNVSASSGSPSDLFGWGIPTGGPGSATLPGFMFDMDVNNGTEDDLNFRSHDTEPATLVGTGRLMATTSGFSNVSPSGPDEGYAWAPNTEYSGSFRIQRTLFGLRLTGTRSDGLSYSVNVPEADIDSDTYDFLGFHNNSRTFGSTSSQGEADNGLIYSNIKITQGVPEPASLALMGLGGLAMLRRRK